jgi:hypothetical protein
MIIIYDIVSLIFALILGYMWGYFSKMCRLEDSEKFK